MTDLVTGIDSVNNTVREQYKNIYKKLDLSSFDDFEREVAIEIIDYRILIKHPLKTTKGVRGMINDIKNVMKTHQMPYEQVRDMMMENEWRTIKDWYKGFDSFKPKKGTVDGKSSIEKQLLQMKINQDKQRRLE